MSAVPNLPHSVIDHRDHTHDLQMQESATQHAEHPHTNGVDQTNGFSTIKDDELPAFDLHNTPIENFRKLKVIVVGAGYSGIYCGIRIPERLRNCDLTIYDKNADLGGTWYDIP